MLWYVKKANRAFMHTAIMEAKQRLNLLATVYTVHRALASQLSLKSNVTVRLSSLTNQHSQYCLCLQIYLSRNVGGFKNFF